MDSNKETLKTSSVKLRKSDPDIQLIPTNSRLSTPVDLASRHNSTPDNLTPNNLIPENLTPSNLTPADNLNLIPNIRPQTVQFGQFDNLSFNPIQMQTSPINPESLNIRNFTPGNFNPGLWNQGHFNANNSSIDLSTLECSIQDGPTTTVRLGNFNRNPEQVNFGQFNPGFNLGQTNNGQLNARPFDHRFSAGLLNPGLFNPGRFNPNYRSFNSLQLNPANNLLSYEGLVHENQGKGNEAKNEKLVQKPEEVQSVIFEEDNSSEKTSKYSFFNLPKKCFVTTVSFTIFTFVSI